MKNIKNNPFLQPRENKYDAIPFDKIKTEDYMPTFEYALELAKANIEKIKSNKSKANFENTILAFETSGELLDEVSSTYFNLYSVESDDKFKALAQQISPMLSAFKNDIMTDANLFRRIKKVYDSRNDMVLTTERMRLVEKFYHDFERNGALLDKEGKLKLRNIETELSKLGPQFSQNLLKATNSFKLHITDENELIGLPDSAKEAAAFTAKQNGKDEGWMFTLQSPSLTPIFKYAKNRELRKKLYMKFRSRAFKGEFDNRQILKKIADLQYNRSKLLGYENLAEYKLEERMAKDTTEVKEFLDSIYSVAINPAKNELNELKKLALEMDGISNLYPWDVSYYSEKLKKKKFDYDEEELRPYFKFENVVKGLFEVATKLYGLQFNSIDNIPVYHPDVQVYKVNDENKIYIGLLYVDLFPRETKNGGAWMTNYRSQGLSKGKIRRPHVSINANFTPTTDKSPSLLRLGEVETLFHEFGHALHSLLSECEFTTLASPNVFWDFVELPSQVMENWVKEKETLDLFARHYQTGKKIPELLIKKVKAVENFNKGMANITQLTYGFLDMAWFADNPLKIKDVEKFEKEVTEKTRILPEIENTNISCSFAHIFGGGYSAGYYSYKWAELLDADAFEYFKKNGIFNKEIAKSFRENILARGNSEHPMKLYMKFRGKKPDPDAMFRRDGLK
ncbi:MAG: M3 family metallopeptidase [Candidatus Cloacimonadota bacterium]|nr:M3 family metallopeptidase [Candidatus Cloacimonadota bacterium]